MALSLSTPLQDALDDTEGNLVALLTFDFGTVYGLWTGQGEITYNSVIYRAGGSLIELPEISENADGSVEELTLALSAAPDKGITPDVLAALFSETWHLRPVTIQIGLLDPDAGTLIGVFTKFRGRVEEASFIEGPDADRIEAKCSSVSIDLSVPGALYRNAATQTRFDAADTSLADIGTLNGAIEKEQYWGQR